KTRLVAAICSIEACTLPLEEKLLQLDPRALSKILITGVLREENVDVYIFPPIPNLVFTRDIGIMIKDHILLSKPAKLARRRESVLAKYIFYFNLFKGKEEYVIEITEDDDFFLEDSENQKLRAVTIEGGDIMMISSNHLIVGCSERTSPSAVDKIIHQIFEISSLEIEYITVVKIKEDRAQMHIDTIFTQVSKSAWVMHPKFSERLRLVKDRERKDYSDLLRIGVDRTNHSELEILQFFKHKNATYDSSKNYLYEESAKLNGLEDLLISISVRDFGVKESEVKIIYSGDNQFPYSEREQWTDSCNLLAIKDGVVVGYDRNERTALSFKEKLGYHIVSSSDLIARFDAGEIKPSQVTNTLILLPSTELSRARGGSHCMSMPLLRDRVKV
ncbi:MAG: arginine deiminase family protein, partial [Bacteroidota bacterium]